VCAGSARGTSVAMSSTGRVPASLPTAAVIVCRLMTSSWLAAILMMSATVSGDLIDGKIQRLNLCICARRIPLERCNPWPHVANRHMSISQLLSSCCYLFTVSNSGLLSVQRPHPASHTHFRHGHISVTDTCEINSTIDEQMYLMN